MPGPLVHRASLKQVRKFLPWFKIKNRYVMKADLLGHHGYDVGEQRGSLFEKLYDTIDSIKKEGKSIYQTHILNHYLVDAHTIGQLSRYLWKRIDRRIDIRSEFVTKKRKYKIEIPEFESKEEIDLALHRSVKQVYDDYLIAAVHSKFLWSSDLKHMVRNAVKQGAIFTVAYLKMLV